MLLGAKCAFLTATSFSFSSSFSHFILVLRKKNDLNLATPVGCNLTSNIICAKRDVSRLVGFLLLLDLPKYSKLRN